MNNYEYLQAVVAGLPSRNPAEDIQWLEERLQPRVSPEGWLDLGDGVRLSFRESGILIENPDLPIERIGTARVTAIKGSLNAEPYRRGLGGNGFETMALYHYGSHAYGGNCAELEYHIKQYFRHNPPRHERERRSQLELNELRQKCQKLESELKGVHDQVADTEKLRERVTTLEAVIRKAAEAVWETRRFVKSKRIAQIRQMLESA